MEKEGLLTYYDYTDAIFAIQTEITRHVSLAMFCGDSAALSSVELDERISKIAVLKVEMEKGASTAVWPATGMTITEMELRAGLYTDISGRVSDNLDGDVSGDSSECMLYKHASEEAGRLKSELLQAKERLVLITGEILPM